MDHSQDVFPVNLNMPDSQGIFNNGSPYYSPYFQYYNNFPYEHTVAPNMNNSHSQSPSTSGYFQHVPIKDEKFCEINQTVSKKRKSGENHKSAKRKSTSPRKKIDRFDGVPEEEVAKKLLPDHLDFNLDIIIIGFNPGLYAAHKGHHYAGPGNHFWKCMYMSGIIAEPFTAVDDYKLLNHRIGFTNMVERTTRGSADLSKEELREGGKTLEAKLKLYKPKIAVFNGKGMYEIFSGKKKFSFGKQPETIEGTDTLIWVMPSSSARCSQLPRATDKVPYYVALKRLIDHLNGLNPNLSPEEIVFPQLTLRKEVKPEPVS